MDKEKLCRVVVKDGVQYITLPNGEIIEGQCETKIEQDQELARSGYATATVLLWVRLDDTKE